MSRSSSIRQVRRARPLLGTIVEITVAGLGEAESHAAIEAAFAAVAEVHRRMSFHDPASTLSQLNHHAAVQPVRVDAETFAVLQCAAEMFRVSGGRFDVTIAPALQALGFLPAWRAELPRRRTRTARGGRGVAGAPPSRVAPDAPSPASFADVQLLPDRHVRFHHSGVRLDLGGIAKGFAVDRAVATLRAAGVPGGLVNAGGDLRAFGGAPFPVTIRHPERPGTALAEIALHDRALATSAHYFADRLVPGATHAPIIDPPSGTPAAGVRSATVRAATAMTADALTKVVMLAGEAALPVLDHFAADAIFVVEGGRALCSPGFHAALQLSS